jgi:hypothetical protein
MSGTLWVEWSYKPEDYFEGPFEQDLGQYQLALESGRATATLSGESYDADPAIIDRIFDHVYALFLGAQVNDHKSFSISRSGRRMVRERDDGGRDVFLQAHMAGLLVTAGKVDLIVTDAAGNIIVDTKAERIRERGEIAQLAARYRLQDPTTASILDSYASAVREPDSELVRLYEIIDALRRRFGTEEKAIATLGLSGNKWKILRKLANSEPLNQGRHRGSHIGQLRDATSAELNEARSVAKLLIRTYLEYLDSNAGGQP